MSEYITLQAATEFCPYTQEYLSLRARQGKLKALKLGRNWVSTRDWLGEYIAKSESYKNSLNGKQHAPAIEPPRNLPIYAPDAEMWEEEIPEDIARQKEFQRKFQFAFAVALVAALFFTATFQGRQQVFTVAGKTSEAVVSLAASLQDAAQEAGFVFGSEVQTYLGAGVGEIAREYIGWLGEHVRLVTQIFRPETKPMAQEVPQAESRGLVVVPSSANEADDEKIKEQIRQSFSDEVSVTPYDEESGIITPVFRERRDEDYLYILVPLRDENSK